MLRLIVFFIFVPIVGFPAETWRAGVARASITPSESMWLAGYASRTRPAEGKSTDLWMKVLALEDAHGRRAVIMTSDTLGIPQGIYRHTCAALKDKFKLEPHQIILSASHTHCGPVLSNSLYDAYPLDDHQRTLIDSYSARFEKQIVDTVGEALLDLGPARVSVGAGFTDFAVNRRNNSERNVPKLLEEGGLKGPADHSVPVLAVYGTNETLKAILFGYACHNTTLAFDKWSGDYAGYAQMALEKNHPGVTALFFNGCGGDQNPLPRRSVELAQRYGEMLASAVDQCLDPALVLHPTISPTRSKTEAETGDAPIINKRPTPAAPVAPVLKTSLEMVTLHFGPVLTQAELQQIASGTNNPSHKRYANRLLDELKAGKHFIRSYPYPVQAWRFGNSQTLITLGGEPVIDYDIKFKQSFGPGTWVAGYCNDVMTYIPSVRVLKEGGYEGGGAMVPYGQPARSWADDVEDLITASVTRLVRSVTAP